MTLAGALRSRHYSGSIRRRAMEYEACPSVLQRRGIQLTLLNAEWARILHAVPHYSELHRRGSVPAQFESIEQFVESVPAITKRQVKENLVTMVSDDRPADFYRTTGGSTAEPVSLPAWKSEVVHLRPDMWLGRSWYGVTPGSRLFMLWGHSHLLGRGARGWANRMLRGVKDRLLGYERFSAYDLRPAKLRQAGQRLVARRPQYVVGYSVALDLFARENGDLRDELRALRLKVVVGTAERFPFPDSAGRLAELFGCPVGMEYGAVETGLIGHTCPPSGEYRAFWRSYLIEVRRVDEGDRVFVTSLYPRCFPLVRYDMGDEVECLDGDRNGVGLVGFRRVIGRCNEYVTLADGTVLHSEVFTHVVRPCLEIAAYQVRQTGPEVEITYLASDPLNSAVVEGIRFRLGRIHPALAPIPIRRVDALERTKAGKTPMVVTGSIV